MLPKVNRLPHTPLVEVLKRGKHASISGMMDIRYVISDSKNISQWAFVVPMSVSKYSVVRNRMKRLLREAVMHTLYKIKPGIIAVIIGKRTLIDLSEAEVERQIRILLKTAKLLL